MTLDATIRQAIGGQVAAADPEISAWVSANAGTGKTRVLINRIVRLMLAGAKPEQILCLTFTKAAAAEMANRLGALLGSWAVMEDADLVAAFEDYTGGKLAHDDIARVRCLFARVTEAPGGLKIRTIHAFCESVLGRFPLEAGVAPHFTVLDERLAGDLRREARDRLIGQVSEAPGSALALAFAHLGPAVSEEDFDALMAALDRTRGPLARLLEAHGGSQGLMERARDHLGVAVDVDPAALMGRPPQDVGPLKEALSALADGSKTDQERAAAIGNWLTSDDADRARLYPVYARAFLTADGVPRKTLITKSALAKAPHALAALEAEQDRVLQIETQLKALEIAQHTEALITVAHALLDAYGQLKDRHAALDYDDLILKTRDLLTRPDGGAGWVHFKLDGGLNHILVDEAQDTAPDQWQVIAALTAEFFAGAGAWEARGGGLRTMFAVGDEKQSIYSFQGADPDAFDAMRDHFESRARAADQGWATLELPLSFRSAWAVLATVDKVFEPEGLRAGLTASGRPVRHIPFRQDAPGLVELWPLVKIDGEDDGSDGGSADDPWDAPLDQPAQSSAEVITAARIAETIARWVGDPADPTRPGDVLILVRKRGPFVDEMVRALKDRDIPVAGTDRMVLGDQLAVMDLIAAAQFVLLPDDDLTLATVLKGPFIGLPEEALFELCHGRDGRLWPALVARAETGDGNGPHQDARERLSAWLAMGDRTPPFEFFSRLLTSDDGWQKLLARLGADAQDPVEEFLSLALQFERDHPPSLEGFIAWLAAGETEIKRDLETGGDLVRIMTVHGAKGLEAPIVFLPDTCTQPASARPADGIFLTASHVLWSPRKPGDVPETAALRQAQADRRAEEEKRLLYVALTRARDRLYVTGYEKKRRRPEDCWYDLIEAGLAREGAVTAAFGPEGAWGAGLRLEDPGQPGKSETAPPSPQTGPTTPPALPVWARTSAPPEALPVIPTNPSAPDEPPGAASPLSFEDGDSGAGARRGVLIHKLLQALPEVPPSEQRERALRYLASPPFSLDEEAREEMAFEVLNVLSDLRFEALFGPGSRAEVAVVGAVGDKHISGRLDRLLVRDTAVTIVDYKTGRPAPGRAEDVPPAYLRQMAAYAALLGRVYPGRSVDAVLIWTQGPSVTPLEPSLLARYAP